MSNDCIETTEGESERERERKKRARRPAATIDNTTRRSGYALLFIKHAKRHNSDYLLRLIINRVGVCRPSPGHHAVTQRRSRYCKFASGPGTIFIRPNGSGPASR